MRSFSEIETAVKRATRGIGFSWGVAEEVGKNIRLLEMFGLPGLKNINQYFKVLRNQDFEKILVASRLRVKTLLRPPRLCANQSPQCAACSPRTRPLSASWSSIMPSKRSSPA